MGKPEASEEGMGPIDKGRHRYAKGDYAGALVAFTQVSTSSRSHLVAHWSSYML
jgi:F-box/TPR repeat protein Pof3